MNILSSQDNSHGRIFQINLSAGGVPKRAEQWVEVNQLGLVGDLQTHTKVHGGVDRALCLFPLELILALQAEGHPIFPGAAGENLTLIGLDWSVIVPQARLRLGGTVLLEITRYTQPCNTIASFLKKITTGVFLRNYSQAGHAFMPECCAAAC